jgi:hypothetical protein
MKFFWIGIAVGLFIAFFVLAIAQPQSIASFADVGELEAEWLVLISAFLILVFSSLGVFVATRGLRFSIRHLLVAMALAALLLALIGMFFRRFAS